MTPQRICPSCGTSNSAHAAYCRDCGAPNELSRAVSRPASAARPPRMTQCPHNGIELLSSGICPDAGGYPYGMACPFACPICRNPLEWSGACRTCHGRQIASDPECFPGDRYDLVDDDGRPFSDGWHWHLTDTGPCAMVSLEHANQIRALIRRLADRELTVADVLAQFPFAVTRIARGPTVASHAFELPFSLRADSS